MQNYVQGITEDIEKMQDQVVLGANGFGEITGEMLLNKNIKEIPSLLEPLLPKSGLVCLAGSSDTGKSAFLRQLSMSVSAGLKTFLGMRLNVEHHSAIYVSTEDDETANAYLIGRQNNDLNMDPASLRGLRFLFDSEDVVAELDQRLTAQPADLVVVDCFSDLYTGSMNEGNQVRQFLMQYLHLVTKHKCLIIFLHHCGKRTETFMPSKHNLLGSQAFEAKMRLVMELRSDLADVTYKHLCCVKGNYLSADNKSESIKLRFTEHLTFKETGERVPFENLVPISTNNEAKYQAIMQLKDDGLTYDEIAKKVGYKDKSGVAKFVQRYEQNMHK